MWSSAWLSRRLGRSGSCRWVGSFSRRDEGGWWLLLLGRIFSCIAVIYDFLVFWSFTTVFFWSACWSRCIGLISCRCGADISRTWGRREGRRWGIRWSWCLVVGLDGRRDVRCRLGRWRRWNWGWFRWTLWVSYVGARPWCLPWCHLTGWSGLVCIDFGTNAVIFRFRRALPLPWP